MAEQDLVYSYDSSSGKLSFGGALFTAKLHHHCANMLTMIMLWQIAR